MRTIWHWNNIFKISVCVLLAAFGWSGIVSAFELSMPISGLGGFIVGMLSYFAAAIKWQAFHFEYGR